MSDVKRKQKEGVAQHDLIVQEAEKRGIHAKDVTGEYGKRATRLTRGDHKEVILQGIPDLWMNDRAIHICDEKQLTKKLFGDLNIPSPKSIVFFHPSELMEENPFDGTSDFVCKPTMGSNGTGVVLNIKTSSDLYDYFQSNQQHGTAFLLEEMYKGYDLRIQVMDGKIIAACKRLSAYVKGDGTSSLQALIDVRRSVIKSQNPSNKLTIDAQSKRLIRAQGHALDSIIPDGVEVRLKEISNMAAGGHAIDVTDELSSEFTGWVNRVSKELKTGYFALDLICTDHKEYRKGSAVALEINTQAEWMHHTFSEVRTHDLAKVVVDALFGEVDSWVQDYL